MDDVTEGRAWVFGDSVDTDNMYPGFALKLPLEEAAKHIFYNLRPGWTDEVGAGEIEIAGGNFGFGSGPSAPRTEAWAKTMYCMVFARRSCVRVPSPRARLAF